MADIPNFRKGGRLLASDMNIIAGMIVRSFRGIPPVSVKRIGSGILIGLGNVRQRRPGVDTVIARIATDDGDGNYTWNKERGEGPDLGTAVELSGLEGVATNTIVTLYSSEGAWVFQASTTDPVGAAFEVSGSGSSTNLPATLSDTPYFLFGTSLYAYGGITVVSSGRAKVAVDGWYTLTMQAKARLAISHGWEFIWRKNEDTTGAVTLGGLFQTNNLSTSNVQDLSLGGSVDVLLAAGDEISTRMASNGGILFNIPTKAQWTIKLFKAVSP